MDLVISRGDQEIERFVLLPTGPITPSVVAAMETGCSERTGIPRSELRTTLEPTRSSPLRP